MRPRLSEILAEKQKEVEELRRAGVPLERGHRKFPVRDFKGVIALPDTGQPDCLHCVGATVEELARYLSGTGTGSGD